jgi:hypothetical protein
MITKKYAEFLKKIESQRGERAEQYHQLVGDLRDIAGRPIEPSSTAAKIVLMGKIRRAEITDDSLVPPEGSMARRIIDAARKRDGREPL